MSKAHFFQMCPSNFSTPCIYGLYSVNVSTSSQRKASSNEHEITVQLQPPRFFQRIPDTLPGLPPSLLRTLSHREETENNYSERRFCRGRSWSRNYHRYEINFDVGDDEDDTPHSRRFSTYSFSSVVGKATPPRDTQPLEPP